MSAAFSQQLPGSDASEYTIISLIVQQALANIQTLSVVEVQSCTNDGGVSPVGTVSVKVLVNLMTGNQQSIPHGTIYNVPYSRLQGGSNAVIMDPEAGDIGLCGFCSRDITSVKNNKGQANPGSRRQFDWADAVYIGGMLNGVPTQYVQFNSSGVTIVSPMTVAIQADTAVTVTAPEITLTGDVTIDGELSQTGGGASTFSGSMAVTGALTGQGTNVHTHTHGGVQTGGGDTGPPL